jgi:hypothetical protein
MNLYVFVEDIKLCVIHPSTLFIVSLCIRFLLSVSTCICFFHPLTAFCFRAFDPVMRSTFRFASIFAVILLIAVLSVILADPSYLETFCFHELPPLPVDWSNVSAFASDDAVCVMQYHGLSIVNAFDLAFGCYDIHRNQSIIRHQFEYFFGQDLEQTISYTIEDLGVNLILLIYNVFSLTVFAFRRFVAVPEFGFQLEMLIRHCGVTLLLALMPGYDMITNQFFTLDFSPMHRFESVWISLLFIIIDFRQVSGQCRKHLCSTQSPT